MTKITDDLLKAAKIVAPTIASFLPGGPLVVSAFTALSNIVLGKPDGTSDEITQAIGQLTPDQIAQVRTKDQEFALKMKELNISADKLIYDDKSSARLMQTQVKGRLVPTLAIIMVSSFILSVGGTLLGYTKVDSATAGMLIGYLSAKAEQIISFYFGSSLGSEKKTDLLAKAEPIK